MWKWLIGIAVLALFACIGAAGAAGGWVYWSSGRDLGDALVDPAAAARSAEAAAEMSRVEAVRTDRLAEAHAVYATGDYARAVDAYADVLEESPASTEAHLGRGRSYARLERYDLAEQDLRRVAEAVPQDREAWDSLAWVLARSGRDAEAVVALDHLVALDENDAKALRDRADARFRTGDGAGARADARRACALGLAEGCALEERLVVSTGRAR